MEKGNPIPLKAEAWIKPCLKLETAGLLSSHETIKFPFALVSVRFSVTTMRLTDEMRKDTGRPGKVPQDWLEMVGQNSER